ncbi:sigma-E processing peptidase SpoIIGA [Anaerolentibacter hominis]|uniref:sigma-E processing peptidase SpoIIGA n=1 Tax=Anaerolentibacter hominis TaxID=3079009 RepID=UPI0031B8A104
MESVIYIDVFFFLNAIMDLLILGLVNEMMHPRGRWRRILPAALFGALAACLDLIFTLPVLLRIILLYGVTDVVMVLLAWGYPGPRRLVRSCILLYAVSWLTAGAFSFLYQRLNKTFWLSVGMTGIILFLFLRQFLQERKEEKGCFRVEITFQGRSVSTTGLLDTGNSLKDPTTGKPVAVAESAVMKELLCKDVLDYVDRVRMIPYHSVGKQGGLLTGIVVDTLTVFTETARFDNEKVVVGLYDGFLSGKNRYHLLIQEDFIMEVDKTPTSIGGK